MDTRSGGMLLVLAGFSASWACSSGSTGGSGGAGTGSASTTAGTGGESSTSTSTGGSTSSSSGSSSSGSAGSGGTTGFCVPQSTQPCYSGAAGTQGVGVCHAGTQTCNAAGTAWGACMGEVTPTAEDCATSADEDCDGLTPACPAATLCAKRFGPGAVNANAVALDGAGNVVITGQFSGTVDFGGGPLTTPVPGDAFVAKFDSACNHLWSRRFHVSGGGNSSDVAVDAAGDVIVAGSFGATADFGAGVVTSVGHDDIFLVKLSAAGAHLWSKRFGDALGDQYGLGVAVEPGGRIALTGNLPGTADFGGGPVNGLGYVALFDAGGQHLWSKGWASGRGQGVAFDAAGNVVVAGASDGPVDFGGGSLGSTGAYAAKLDPTGQHLWSKVFATTTNFYRVDVGTDAAGNVILSGPFSGAVDFGGGALTAAGGTDVFVAKLDPGGNHAWSKRFGDAADQAAYRLAVLPGGDVVLTGDFFGGLDFGAGLLTSAGDSDAFLVRLDPTGAPIWSKRFGDAAAQGGLGVATDSAGNVAFVGRAAGTIDLGLGPLSGNGYDGFLARLGP